MIKNRARIISIVTVLILLGAVPSSLFLFSKKNPARVMQTISRLPTVIPTTSQEPSPTSFSNYITLSNRVVSSPTSTPKQSVFTPTTAPPAASTPTSTPSSSSTTNQSQSQETLYISPATKNFAVNESFTIDIYMKTSYTVNAVQAVLSYPSDTVDIESISYNASPFDLQVQEIKSGGTIKIVRGTLSSATGEKRIAQVTAKAKKSGTATVQFTEGTQLMSKENTKNILTGTTGGTFTIQ